MKPWSVDDLTDALMKTLSGQPSPMGVGDRAFPRMGPGLFLHDYRLLCSRRTKDLQSIRSLIPVDCLEEKIPPHIPPCRDTLSLLSHPFLRKMGLVPQPGNRLLVYQENPGLRELAHTHGWKLLASSFQIRTRWENKAWFRLRLQEAGFHTPGINLIPLNELTRANFRNWQKQWGRRLVIQIPDFPRGGGRATFFVTQWEEVDRLRHLWGEGNHRDHAFQKVLVSPWFTGPSISMEGCVTPWGLLISPLQMQLLEISQVLPPGGSGRFCGHQWGEPKYPPVIEGTARTVMQWVGEALQHEGYRGIFGVDFVLDITNERLYALECNPRYTGAFPTLTLLQHCLGLAPLEGFHVLAWLDRAPPVPVEALNWAYRAIPSATQVILFHRGEEVSEIPNELEAGRYRWDPALGTARRVGEPLPFPSPPWNPLEFVILDGPPSRGSELLPGRELDVVLRAVFLWPAVGEDGRLIPHAVAAVRWIYRSLGLRDD